MPGLANTVLQAKTTGWAIKRLSGLSTKRPAPLFATEGFRRSAAARRANETVSPTVVLWPDTFSDVYEPGASRPPCRFSRRRASVWQSRGPGVAADARYMTWECSISPGGR